MNGLYDEIRVAVHSVWTRRWLVLAVAWGICILGWLAVASIPNRYDSRARLALSAAVPAEKLYRGEQHDAVFKRTLSRLTEMQSTAYLALPHLSD